MTWHEKWSPQFNWADFDQQQGDMGSMWAWSVDSLLAVSDLLCPGFSCLTWSWMSAVYRLNAWKDEYKHVFGDTYKPFCTRRCWCRRVTLRVINPTDVLPHKTTKSTPTVRIWSVSPVFAAQWVREWKREEKHKKLTEKSVACRYSSKNTWGAAGWRELERQGFFLYLRWGTEAGLQRNEVVTLFDLTERARDSDRSPAWPVKLQQAELFKCLLRYSEQEVRWKSIFRPFNGQTGHLWGSRCFYSSRHLPIIKPRAPTTWLKAQRQTESRDSNPATENYAQKVIT